MAVFIKTPGVTNYRGLDSEYDQVDYPGQLSDYTITRNANGTITVEHPTLGTDTLTSIEGFWFQGETAWYSADDAVAQAGGGTGNTLTGTNTNNTFTDLNGDTIIDGNGGAYNQVDFAGRLADYTFTQNADGSVTVAHPTRGTDTLTDIDGLWFQGEGAWYSMVDALAAGGGNTGNTPTNGNDTLTGTAGNDVFVGSRGNDTIDGNGGAYNQVDYAGRLSDYSITQNPDGSVTVDHPTRGTDTLTDIDGLWFQGEAGWYAMADALAASTGPSGGTLVNGVYTGTNGNNALVGDTTATTFYSLRGNDTISGRSNNDTLNVDGDVVEWTITQNANGTATMSHAMWGIKTVEGIDMILFGRSGESMTVAEAIAATEGLPAFRMDADGVLNGTPGNDIMNGNAQDEFFYGGVGNDTINGRGGFDQVNYDGERDDYTITQNGDGSYQVEHDVWGIDTVRNVEGFYFSGNNEWISEDNLI